MCLEQRLKFAISDNSGCSEDFNKSDSAAICTVCLNKGTNEFDIYGGGEEIGTVGLILICFYTDLIREVQFDIGAVHLLRHTNQATSRPPPPL